MFFHRLINKNFTEYFVSYTLNLTGELEISKVRQSLDLLSEKFEVLRTSIVMPKKGVRPWQVILRDREIELNVFDLSMSQSPIDELAGIKQSDLDRGFDLEKDSLLRMTVIRLSKEKSVMLCSFHHIILDGWSSFSVLTDFIQNLAMLDKGVTLNEIKERIRNEKSAVATYGDYIRWLEKQDRKTALGYWEELLQDYSEVATILPIGTKTRTDKQMERLTLHTSLELTNTVKSFAKSKGISVNTILESALGILLQKYNNTNDVVFGKVVSGRSADIVGIDQIAGLFINTIPVRVKNESDDTCGQILEKMHSQATNSSSYEYCSLAEIQRLSGSGGELIKVLFVYENYYVDENAIEEGMEELGDKLAIDVGDYREQTNYSINVSVSMESTLDLDILYDPRQYCNEEIQMLVDRYRKIIQEIVEHPERKIGEIDIADEEERERIITQFNDTSVEYQKDMSVAALFEEQVDRVPDRAALIFKDRTMTYGELNQKADILAIKLRSCGIRPDDYVAIMAERSFEMIIGIIAVIKSGGAYVPIDPNYPRDRIDFMLEDCKPKLVLQYNVKNQTDLPVMDLSDERLWEGNSEGIKPINRPDDLLYLIYTSGTTGKPKGVMIEHKGISNLKCFFKKEFGISEEDIILQFANSSFDASAWEIFMALLSGAALCLVSEDIINDTRKFEQYTEEKGVSVVTLPPIYLNSLSPDRLPKLKRIISAGSAANAGSISTWKDRVSYVNAYGPTETTVCATFWQAENREDNIIPIGKPLTNTSIFILDRNERLMPIGVPGEICVGGVGLARGYLNRPELTEEKFTGCSYYGGELVYKTGDLGRWLPDGNIEFLGRIDDQIKLRGFRIELGEIESVIRRLEGVNDVAVIVSGGKEEKNISAYIVAEQDVNISDIREEIKKSLPGYMIPAYMMKIDRIPVNRSGKLDKKALPKINVDIENEYIAPRNETEEAIARIFQEVLGVKRVGIRDDFFEIGGHSLKATGVINKIEEATGVRLPVIEMFNEPTVEGLSNKITGREKSHFNIPRAVEKEAYPMSPAQKRIFVICGLDDTGILYNMSRGMEVEGKLDASRVNDVFNQLIERHEALRTGFLMENGEAIQKIAGKISTSIEYEEVEQVGDDEKVRLLKEFVRPFDLGKAPLVRIKVVKARNGNDLLFFDMHHIISDGMSINIITEELTRLYAGERLEKPGIQYKDYSEWMRGRDISNQKAYWINEFKDTIPVLDLPLDFHRPLTQSFVGNTVECIIDKEIKDGIEGLCRASGTTEYMVLLSSLMVLLGKYSRQEDIIVGSPISGRVHGDTEKIIGMFVNTLAMRGEPKGEKTFEDFLKEMREKCLKAQENQEYPFDELVEAVEVNRDLSRNPLFDVIFSFHNAIDETELAVGGATLKEISFETIIAKFDLTVTVINMGDSYKLTFEYCSDLFRESSIYRMMLHFINLIKEITLNSKLKLEEYGVVDEEEKERIIKQFNNATVEYPKDKTVVELFEEQAARLANKSAVVFEEQKLTYGELNNKANQLALKLRELGIRPDDFVAVMAERSIEMIIGICGIIKAGGAIVVIDPAYPKERIDYMLGDCNPKALLVYNVDFETDIPTFDLSGAMEWDGVCENIQTQNKPKDLIYLIYTSGTTGKPKGVMIEHRSVIRLVCNANYVELNENTVLLQTGSLSFDAATFEIWGTLLNGGELHLAGSDVILDARALKQTIKDQSINTMFLTTALFNQLVNLDETVFEHIDTLLFGGEKASEIHIRKLIESNNKINLVNLYGPTETTTLATWYPINNQLSRDKTPIGKPVSNTEVYVLDGMNLCGIGMPGELCIAGVGVARGYLNHPEFTAEKFIDNPFGEGKMYRSGDMARWLPDGNIEFLGRADEQIKLRGFRIELGEIESVIRKLGGVKDVVLIMSEEKERKYICAYIVAEPELDISDIRGELRNELPDYMIPSYMMKLDKLPVNRNGKVDRKALPKIELKSEQKYIAPRNETEKVILEIFEEVLGMQGVGIGDNFFEIGGDSIKAIRVVSKLREKNYSISMREIVQQRTIEQIIKSIRKTEQEVEYSQDEVTGEVALTPIQNTFFKWKLLKPGHFNQSMMIMSRQGLDENAVKQTLGKIIEHHDILRAVFKDGKQEIFSIKDSKMFELRVFDLRNLNDEMTLKTVEAENTKLQGSFDLSGGPLVKAAMYNTSDGDHLMICIHHLVIDGVSWRIFIEDFDTGYRQFIDSGKIQLPKKTLSYKEWSNELIEYGKSQAIQNEIPYWKKISEQLAYGKIECDADGMAGGYGSSTLELDAEKTNKLLYRAGRAYDTDINDILLASLGMAFQMWKGRNKLVIQLEGHGREEINKNLHIDRTIGWFTCMYPIVLEASDFIGDSIIKTKEMLRSIPNHGLGYSIIKNSLLYEAAEIEPDISFNYLGEIDRERKDNSVLEKSLLPDGVQIARENIFSNIILNGVVDSGRFVMEIWYDKAKYTQNAIDGLLKCYERMLDEVVEHCTGQVLPDLSEDKPAAGFNAANSEIQVTTENIFAMKQYDVSNFMNTQLYEELMRYEDNIKGEEPYDCYEPFAYQKTFLVDYPEVCCARTEITGKMPQEKLTDIIKQIIKEQSIFRVSYNKNNDYLQQFSHIDNWYIPYIDISDSPVLEDATKLFDSVLSMPQLFEEMKLLAKVVIARVSSEKHYIYFYIHHGAWDLVSTEVLRDIIKAGCLGIKELIVENSYINYSKERRENEKQVQLQKDARQFVDIFLKQMMNYNRIMKQETPKYRTYIKYRLKADTVEKVLADPILWAIQLYSLLNIEESSEDIERSVPFLSMHFGRDDIGFKTLGLYLDLIPYIFDDKEKRIISFGNKDKCNYGNLLFNPDFFDPNLHKKFFKNVPVVNFFADLEMEVDFGDFGEYNIEIKEDTGLSIITCRVLKDVLYVIIPTVDNDEKRISKAVEEYLGL